MTVLPYNIFNHLTNNGDLTWGAGLMNWHENESGSMFARCGQRTRGIYSGIFIYVSSID